MAWGKKYKTHLDNQLCCKLQLLQDHQYNVPRLPHNQHPCICESSILIRGRMRRSMGSTLPMAARFHLTLN